MGDAQIAVVIEDDEDIRDLTVLVLEQAGFAVHSAADGAAGIEMVRAHDPLLTTLDLQMPGMDGLVVAERLRQFSSTYLIMVTSRSEEADVIAGFEAGADDYLTKPFRPRELRARADAMLRRLRVDDAEPAAVPAPEQESWAAAAARELREAAGTSGAVPAPEAGRGSAVLATEVLRCADLELDPTTGQVTLAGEAVALDAAQQELLSALMSTGSRVRSKADLVLALQGTLATSYFVSEADKADVDRHVTALRRSLGDDADRPRFIETVRGVGYRMVDAGR